MSARKIEACRICGDERLVTIIDLGDQVLSGHFPRPEDAEVASLPLALVKCDNCHLVQLEHSVDINLLYHENYGYRSGINQTMRDHLGGIAEVAKEIAKPTTDDVVVDIASNDGTLLGSYSEGGPQLVGIDPSIRQFGEYYRGDIVKIPEFFSADAFSAQMPGKKAKIITSIAVFYDCEDPRGFVADIKEIMATDGIWILEQSDLKMMIEANSFDTICHEHLEYYSFAVLKALAEGEGLRVFDVTRNASNGGSSRVFVCHADGPYAANAERIDAVLREEAAAGLTGAAVYAEFAKALEHQKRSCLEFIRQEKALGKSIHIYGASTKGNVLLQSYGLGVNEVDVAADRNPRKWGCTTPGTKIPIVSEETSRAMNPDYYLVLPWHFRAEFETREKEFIDAGGRFIFPLPNFEIYPNV